MIETLPPLRGTPWKGYVRLAKKMVRSGSLSPIDRFLTDSVYLSAADIESLCTPQLQEQFVGADPFRMHRGWFSKASDADFVNQMLYVDAKTFLPSLNLNITDKTSMAASVELRVPFLDWQLCEWVAQNVPASLKLKGSNSKYIFRKAIEPLVPAEVLRQPKAGFGAPVDHWLANDLRPMVDELLSEDCVRRRTMFSPAAVRSLITEHRAGQRDWSMQIWQLLTLEIWMRKFVDKAPQSEEQVVTARA